MAPQSYMLIMRTGPIPGKSFDLLIFLLRSGIFDSFPHPYIAEKWKKSRNRHRFAQLAPGPDLL